MKCENGLSSIKCGESAVVKNITASGTIRRRLLDIGLTPGTKIECVGTSPLGDPVAFLIRGAVIAIRKEDCGDIWVEKLMEG